MKPISWSANAKHKKRLRWITQRRIDECFDSGQRRVVNVTYRDEYITWMLSYKNTDIYYIESPQHILIVDVY